MCLSGQPALKVRLAASSKQQAASSKRDGNERAWVLNAAPTAAAVWAERTWSARSRLTPRKVLVQFSELVFCCIEMSNLRRPC